MRNNLYTLLKADEKQMRKIIKKILKENGYKVTSREDFIYAEGTVPVLLVGHYDTVAQPPRYIKNDNGVLSGLVNGKPHQLGADDRAGIYAILETIRKHHCHVLFTGGEERGGIGAEAFTRSDIKPDVNYVLEFDRRGSNDAVYYWSENEEFEEFITSHGWETAEGSYTDIVDICPYLGVMGVNLSIGYHLEHTTYETLDTDVMNENIKRIPELLYSEKKYEYKEKERTYGNWFRGLYEGGYGNSYWHSSYYDDEEWYDKVKYAGEEDESMYCITYENEYEMVLDYELWAKDYFSAVGYFLVMKPHLTYDHIIEVYRYTQEEIDKMKEEEDEEEALVIAH